MGCDVERAEVNKRRDGQHWQWRARDIDDAEGGDTGAADVTNLIQNVRGCATNQYVTNHPDNF